MTASQAKLDIDALRQWIGRTERWSDVATPRLVASLCATLDMPQRPGTTPACMHWCLAPPIWSTQDLGEDGHAARGGFLPPVPLPRRMWAGGEVSFQDAIRVGDVVKRVSRVVDVSVKQGRSGCLCFVIVEHEVATTRGRAILERQDIVYRDDPRIDSLIPQAAVQEASTAPPATWRREIHCNAVLLFRYSALTFNAHRIHYDVDFCRRREGYPGLIVHGPLQSSFLLELATSIRGRVPRKFVFRALAPLFGDCVLSANAVESGDALRLWIADESGRQTMAAKAFW